MQAIDLLLTRRSVKPQDLIEPAPDGVDLDRILEAGIRVPDHGKLSPWRVQVIRRQGQDVLGDLYAQLFVKEHGERASQAQIEAERQRPKRSPLLLAVTAHPEREHPIPILEQHHSNGAMCMNILNAAHALGYAGNWVTGWASRHPAVKQALGHDEETEIVAFIHLGTAKEAPEQRPRPDVAEIASEWTGQV